MGRLVPSRRGAITGTVLTSTLILVGCASLRHVGREEAISAALQNVCGVSVADSTCAVRAATKVHNGYRVVVDRRLSAGHDRVAVVVRPGGHVDVTPVDSGAAIR
jgi:hypothetical protein